MKGYRFYLEHDSPAAKRKNQSTGNVFAAFIYDSPGVHGGRYLTQSGGKPEVCIEGLGALYFHPNSAVCGTAAALEYLRTRCKRISEKQAREIHPALFDRLDEPEFVDPSSLDAIRCDS